MEMVVDTSVIIAVIAGETGKEGLVRATRGADLIAPHSVHWEIGNAFSAMLKQKRIEVEEAIQALELYRSIPVRFVEIELEQALLIADRLGIYAYDAYLLRCCDKYRAPLISLDQELIKAARRLGQRTIEVTK